jgi:putative transposase
MRVQRVVSRRQKGGKNRKKAVRSLVKLHRQIKNQRHNTLHQVTTRLAKTKSVLIIEDLHVSGMMKNHRLAQAIGDVGFAEFKRQLLYKASWYGARVLLADRWEPSSKRCSGCGWLDQDLTLSDRTFHCEQCGLVLDRDLNAAINLEKLAGSFVGQPKRLWSRQRWQQPHGWCATVCETRAPCPKEAGTERQRGVSSLGKVLRTETEQYGGTRDY